MIGYRVLGAAAAAILVGSLGALAGCASNDAAPETVVTAKDVQAASVTLTVHDGAGNNVAQGSGILIAPRLVMTSAHLVAGMARWTVTSADGKSKVNGIRGMSYDWMNYEGSSKSHPRKHDIAVIYLDAPIALSVYPQVSSDVLADGASATRMRSNGLSFQTIPSTFTHVNTFPHAYVTSMPDGESVEPGDAVLNDKNEIVGLVTGTGTTTGQLYVARTNDLSTWLAPKAVCGGSGAATVRTYSTPPPKPGCDTPGNGSSSSSSGNGSSSSSSGNGSSSSSSGTGTGSSGSGISSGSSGTNGSSSGTSGSSGESSSGSSGGGDNPGCDDGGGYCHGDCSGVPNVGSSSGSSGPSSNVGSPSGNNGSSSSGNSVPSTGTNGSSSGFSGPGSNPNGGESGEVCEGPSDNPQTCPVEPNGCEGNTCGGGTPDDNTDYGGCASCSSDNGGVDIIVR